MKNLVLLTCCLAGTAGLTSCVEDWGRTNVPEVVNQRFVDMYPTAERVDWEEEGQVYEVDFEISSWERSALFSASGELIRYSEEIEEQYLPAAALSHIQRRYTGYTIDEVERVQEGQQTYYEVDLENDNQLVLLFDEGGQLLEQQASSQGAAPKSEQASLMGASPAAPSSPMATLPAPASRWELPAELREVSGIALLNDNLMACIQDEDGTIYLYDLAKKAITRTIDFAGKGDYEGLTIVDKTAYVLRSDGALYEVSLQEENAPKAQLYPSVLAKTQDTEGLAYDKANNRLLIAPKGYDEALGKAKGLYAFSLADKKMLPEPVIRIALDQEMLTAAVQEEDPYDLLQPSSLEVNPASGALYLLDAENHLLLTLSPQGALQKIISLDKDQLRQPEGFAFNSKGELYLASEGSKKGKGVILKFTSGY